MIPAHGPLPSLKGSEVWALHRVQKGYVRARQFRAHILRAVAVDLKWGPLMYPLYTLNHSRALTTRLRKFRV